MLRHLHHGMSLFILMYKMVNYKLSGKNKNIVFSCMCVCVHVYTLVSIDEAMTGPISHPTLCVYMWQLKALMCILSTINPC